MSVAPIASLPHPLVRGVEQIEGALDRMPVDGWSGLEAVTLRECAERLMRVEARVKAQLMAVTRALDETGLAKASGATSTGAMLAAFVNEPSGAPSVAAVAGAAYQVTSVD